MNNCKTEIKPCDVCTSELVESIGKITRDNSDKISHVFGSLTHIKQYLDGESECRDYINNKPQNMRDELLWQRSMLCRIEEELYKINEQLGC